METLLFLLSTSLIMVINSLFILGLNGATQEDYVLHKPSQYLAFLLTIFGKAGEMLFDTLLGCIKCMSTFWGVTVLLTYLHLTGFDVIGIVTSWKIVMIPFYTLSLSYLNCILINFE